MEDTKSYTCAYCYKEFEPKRRRVQKYCSNTCRSKAHHARKNLGTDLSTQTDKVATGNATNVKDKMTLAGIGNATAGSLIADTLKSYFTKNENKPATVKDLNMLIETLQLRYHRIKNGTPDVMGKYPYFDMFTKEIVFM